MTKAPVDEVVGMFLLTPEQVEAEGLPRTVTFRCPAERLAWVDAMAKHAEVSRSVMVAELVRVGISEVLGKLPDAVRDEIANDVTEGDE